MIPSLRNLSLAAWHYGTLPLRQIAARRAAQAGQSPVMVLYYHRVADAPSDMLTISNSLFVRQMEWVQQHCDVVSLAEAQRRVREGCSRATVSITFDDGYADNCAHALPYLVKHKLPCTYFVTLGHVLSGEPFPHDVARGARLSPNNLAQIRALADAGVEIGGHTRSHANLGELYNVERLHDEVMVASSELQSLARVPVRYFAFPFGLPANLNARAIVWLRAAGYAGVCSAYGDYNWPGDDAWHIKRIHADPDMLRFKNWLTVDPRKRKLGRSLTERVSPLFATPMEPAVPATEVSV